MMKVTTIEDFDSARAVPDGGKDLVNYLFQSTDYFDNGDYNAAIAAANNALDTVEKDGLTDSIPYALCLKLLFKSYFCLEDYEMAIEYGESLDKWLSDYSGETDIDRAEMYYYLALSHSEIGNQKNALAFSLNAIDLENADSTPKSIRIAIRYIIADICCDEENYVEAWNIIAYALDMAKADDSIDVCARMEVFYLGGFIAMKNENYPLGQELFLKAEDYCKRCSPVDKEYLADIYDKLSIVYGADFHPIIARKYDKLVKQLRKS